MDHEHGKPHEQEVETDNDGREVQETGSDQQDQGSDNQHGEDITYDTSPAGSPLIR